MSAQASPESGLSLLRRSFLWALPGLLIALIALELSAALDLPLSRLFYRSGQGFFLDQAWPVQFIYFATPWLMRVFGVGMAGVLIWTALTKHKKVRNIAAYALLVLSLGPGLVVNTVLKDHWGRPRPEQLAEFGGKGQYVPPLWISEQCGHNCSFVSGHAASGFFFITGAWIWPRRRWAWLGAGIAAGGLIGVVRIVQGGHFLSDVIGSLIVVWFTNELVYRWMFSRGWLEPPPEPAKAPG